MKYLLLTISLTVGLFSSFSYAGESVISENTSSINLPAGAVLLTEQESDSTRGMARLKWNYYRSVAAKRSWNDRWANHRNTLARNEFFAAYYKYHFNSPRHSYNDWYRLLAAY